MTPHTFCPLCKKPTATWDFTPGLPSEVVCDFCGRYQVEEEFLTRSRDLPTSPELAGLARERNLMEERLLITWDNYTDLIKLAPKTAMEKARKFLSALCRKSLSIGFHVTLDRNKDIALAYAKNPGEFNFLFTALNKLGWITHGSLDPSCTVTIEGWQEFDRIQPNRSVIGFVAMAFAPEFDPIYKEGIAPAIGDVGYSPFRTDVKEHIGRIDDLIMASIQECRFVVADFTAHRPGVYFEAGYALGLGLPVIWTCRDSDIKDLHFDIRQYNCIKWTDYFELRDKLSNRIRAAIGSKH